ncbi:MAG: hypothetical protein ACYC4H_13180 [Desulfocucumaceae bacterium]
MPCNGGFYWRSRWPVHCFSGGVHQNLLLLPAGKGKQTVKAVDLRV